MKFLELFSGSATFSRIAKERGHEARTLDFNPDYGADYCADITTWDFKSALGGWRPDVIWASPDCRCFSVASIGRNWRRERETLIPRREETIQAMNMVRSTLAIIEALKPKRYFIENPRGMLRKMDFMPKERKTATYCQYGDTRQKPTDIWTNSSWIWVAKEACARSAQCHVAAPRGSKTPGSTQGIGHTTGTPPAFERTKLPPKLCEEIVKHLEDELVKN